MNPILSLPTPGEVAKYRRRAPVFPQGFPPITPAPPPATNGCTAWYVSADLAAFVRDLQKIVIWPDRIGGNNLVVATAAPIFWSNLGAGSQSELPNAVGFDIVSGTTQALSNTTLLADRQNFSCLWIGELQSAVRTMYLLRIGNTNLVLEHLNGTIQVFASGTTDSGLHVPTNRLLAIVLTSSPAGMTVYVDSVNNFASMSAASRLVSSSLDISGSGKLYGRIYEVACWGRGLTTHEVGRLLEYSRITYGSGTSYPLISGRVVFDGDSVSEGAGTTRNGSFASRLGVNRQWLMHNFGLTGQLLSGMISSQSVPNAFANSTNWLFVEGGYNDLSGGATGATVEGRLNTYCTAAISAGYSKSNIVVFTLATSGTPTERDNANTAIRSNYTGYAGTLVDVAADTDLGVIPAGGFNNSSFYFDGVHPNDKGVQKLVELIRATVAMPF